MQKAMYILITYYETTKKNVSRYEERGENNFFERICFFFFFYLFREGG